MTNNQEPTLLQEAEKNIRNQQYQDALDILLPYIKVNPRSENGWLLLSYAVDGFDKKLECLEKVLELNPENVRARERHKKVQSLALSKPFKDPTQISGDGKSRKIRKAPQLKWVIPIISILLISLIGYIGWTEIIPTFLPIENQVITGEVVLDIHETNDEFLPPTQTQHPTQTQTKQPIETVSPSESKQDSLTGFKTPAGSLALKMDDLQNQVSSIRGLGILSDDPRYIIPPTKVRRYVGSLFEERYTEDEVNDLAIVLKALGLIDPTYDLYNQMLTSIDEGLGGFYIPWTDELFIIGNEFNALQETIFVHEFDHALVDQHFHLENIGVYPECIHETDQCLAISALIEGDATYLMNQWLRSYADDEKINEILNTNFSPVDTVISSSNFPPPYLIREINFKYLDGQNFVSQIYDQGGWTLINEIYQNLPTTSEQILHPDKYLSGEGPVEVNLQSLDDILDEDWRHITTSSLGEVTTEMILGSSYSYLAQIDPTIAATAASGWGGDQYQVYFRNKTIQSLMVIKWTWDTIEDRNEFLEAMQDYLNKRYLGSTVKDSEFNCWTKINNQFSCLLKYKIHTLWITAPTWEDISLLLDKYPDFH